MSPLVPVESGSEALGFRPVEVLGDRLAQVPDDVGAGVGDVLAEVAPLARGAEQGAEGISNALLAAPGQLVQAASNLAEIRA